MSITQRVFVLAGAGLAFMALLGGVGIYSVDRVAQLFADYRQTSRMQMLVADIGEDFMQARLAALRYRMRPQQAMADEVAANIDEILRIDDQLAEVLLDRTMRDTINGLRTQARIYGDVFAASRDKGRSERERAFQRTLLDVIGPKISAELDSIQNGLQVRQNKLGPMAASVIRVFEYQVLVAAVVALILALAGGFFFGRSISRPVQGLTRAMAQIAAADGTRIRVPYATRPDEVGEMARALEDFRKRLIENEQLRSAKDRFLATLNHELRTPLNAIVGFADVLVSVGDDPRFAGRRGEYLTYIRDAGNTLVDLVNDILELYKTTGEREEVPHEPVVMRRLIEDAATMARAAHHNRDGDVIIDADPTLRLTCYPTGIRQTVLNLVTNAIKYSEAPYSVTVSLSRGAGGSLLLSVADRGVGISAEQIGEVVRPFARVQSTVSSQVVGTGLGLALVEMQVHAHDAVLQIESTPGVGSTFTIEFPGSRVTSSDGQHPAPSGSTEPPPSVSRVAESGPLRRAS